MSTAEDEHRKLKKAVRATVLAVTVFVLVISNAARADYLEIRRDAWLKKTPAKSGVQLEKLVPNTPVALSSETQQNAYYKVKTRAGTRGFVYRTLVRRHAGRLPALPAPPENDDDATPAAVAPLANGQPPRLAQRHHQAPHRRPHPRHRAPGDGPLLSAVSLPRENVTKKVAKGARNFSGKTIDKAIYATGWDGTVVITADRNGAYEVRTER